MIGEADAHSWSEADSETFIERAPVFVPWQQEQISVICGLIPAEPEEDFVAIELGAGGGALARSILESFPRCRYLALDGSEAMRERLRKVLSPFGDRIEVRQFDLEGEGWRDTLPAPLRCVLASLIVHHLDGNGKRQLFADVGSRLEAGGLFLMVDLVEPVNPRASGLYARQWDQAARAQSIEVTGSLTAYEAFKDGEWNYYDEIQHDPYDQPSRLFDQLVWLRDAGFKNVDCFWIRAGHAIFGGYR